MEIKKHKVKQLCPHKMARLAKSRESAVERTPSRQHKQHYSSHKKIIVKDLMTQNEQLKTQNAIFQQYFATFEVKYKEQKRENRRLQKRIEQLSRERDTGNSHRKTQSTYLLSDRTMEHRASRATKESRKTLPSQYF